MQRRYFYLIGFLVLLIFDTLAQVSFKLGAMHTAPAVMELAWFQRLLTEKWIYIALSGYLGAFITYMTLLKHAPIGPAFAASHMQIVTVLVISVLYLHERLDPPQLLGSALIIAGVLVLASGKCGDTI